jgi:hypothetical protein
MADDRQRYVQERHTLAHAIVDTVRESLIASPRAKPTSKGTRTAVKRHFRKAGRLPSARTDPVGFGLRQAAGIRWLKVGSVIELAPYARRLAIASTIMLYRMNHTTR